MNTNTTWTVKIERLCTHLRVGVHDNEREPQLVWVTVRLRGVSAACPATLGECIDYEPLCRWITDEWPETPHTPLLETRINELVDFVFDFDARVQEVHVGLAKQRMSRYATSVGIERGVSRAEREAERRHLAAASRGPHERANDECLSA